jgi:hypothetical protein
MSTFRLLANPFLLVCIALGLAMSGCNMSTGKKAIVGNDGDKTSNNDINLPCKLNTSATTSNPTNDKISLTIDGSASMLGYVKNSNSRYVKTLKLLDQITLAHNGGVEYFRLDDNKKKIGRAEFQKTAVSDFYTGQTSKIADAFNPISSTPTSSGNQLLVIVTDLQPDDGDVAIISKRMLEDYLKKDGQAVAIWGIKSEFDGLVYPPNNSPSYSFTTKSLEKGRPFYILMAGSYASIVEFGKTLRSQGGSLFAEQAQFTIFTPTQLVKSPAYLSAPKNDLPNGIDKRENLVADDKFPIDAPENQPVQLLEFGANSGDGGNGIKYELEYQPSPDTAVPTKLEPKYQSLKYNSNPEKPDFISAETPPSLTITSAVIKNKLAIELKINPTNFPQGLYYTTADLVAKTVAPPSGWTDWNDAGKKDGSKTQGLNDFLNTLSINTSSVMQSKPPVFARLCYGFKRN